MTGRLAAGTFVLLTILLSCLPLLVGGRFAFRDVNHFYLPLYEYVGARTAAEWLPMWNPLDHFGMPLLGETTTAVLYPARYLIYLAPIPSEWAMNAYLIAHLILASATSASLANQIGCRRVGVIIAAIVYPLSGSVFSLCCNPPFLVGAAWLPLVLGSCLHLNEGHAFSLRKGIGVAAFALSMMVLGGDPQSALHCVIVVAVISAFRTLGLVVPKLTSEQNSPVVYPWRSLVVIGCGCLLAASICALQIAASLDWSRQSDRLDESTRQADRYAFSLAPWHAAETITPRPFGQFYPDNRRVSKMLRAEGRMWTPSIYAGLIVGLALLCRACSPRQYFSDPWFLLAIAAFGLCLGHYGIVWLLQQIPGVLVDHHSAIGGPYWILVNVLPGYDAFRYPPKWLPAFAIAGAMVTARWFSQERNRTERTLSWITTIGLLSAASFAFLASRYSENWFVFEDGHPPVDEYWGALKFDAGFRLVAMSCVWSASLVLALSLLRSNLGIVRQRRRLGLVGIILLVSIDCSLSAMTLLPTVNIEREIRVANQASPSPIPRMRTLRTQSGMWPETWKTNHSELRVLEVAASERIAWFGRWHLTSRTPVVNSMVSIQSRHDRTFWRSCYEQLSEMDPIEQREFWKAIREWLAIGAVSHVDASLVMPADGLSLVYAERKVVGEAKPIRIFARWQNERPLREVIASIAESGELPVPAVPIPLPEAESDPPATLDFNRDGRIRVQTESPCILERCVYQDGNWTAVLVAASGEIVRLPVVPSSRLNQAVLIPPGDWLITFEYRPWWTLPSAIAMVGGVIALLFCILWPNPIRRPMVWGIEFFRNTGRLLIPKN